MKNLFQQINEITQLCNIGQLESFSDFNTEEKYSIIRLKYFETIDEMLELMDWRGLERVHTFKQADWTGNYDKEDNLNDQEPTYSKMRLPTDFLRVTHESPLWSNDTFYDASPVTALRDWALFADYNFSWPEKFRLNPITRTIDIIPALEFDDNGNTESPLRFAYITNQIYEHPNGSKASVFPNDSDFHLLLDSQTVIYGTVGRYLTHQGRNENYYWSYYQEKMKQVHRNEKSDTFIRLGASKEYTTVDQYKQILEQLPRRISKPI